MEKVDFEERGRPVQWYLLKTWAGREEELAAEIRREFPDTLIKECFVIVQERIWVRQKRNIIHEEPLFPGCVFLTCSSLESATSRIGRIPAVARWRRSASLEILRMTEADGEFLAELSGKEHRVKLSCVLKDEQGKICKLSGPLKLYREQIERIQFKKRYAMIRHRLWGEDRTLVLGIVLQEDIDQECLSEGRFIGKLSESLYFMGDTFMGDFYRRYKAFDSGDSVG